MRPCAGALCLLLMSAAGVSAQTSEASATTTLIAQPLQPPSVIALTIGRGQLLQFTQDLIRVVVAEPKVADAIVVSPRELMVTAKGLGKTTLAVWEGSIAPARFDINVSPDPDEENRHKADFAAELKAAAPESSIVFNGNAATM